MSFESRVGIRGGHRVRFSASAEDYTQPKCAYCGKPISDDRLEARGADPDAEKRFCRSLCAAYAGAEKRGERRVGVRGPASRWRHVYEQARLAHGAWVEVPLDSEVRATRVCHSMNQRRDFEALVNGCVVSVRLVVPA